MFSVTDVSNKLSFIKVLFYIYAWVSWEGRSRPIQYTHLILYPSGFNYCLLSRMSAPVHAVCTTPHAALTLCGTAQPLCSL